MPTPSHTPLSAPFSAPSSAPIDLGAYLARIGWRGPAAARLAPDLNTLHALVDAHMRAVPFENLDVLLGRPIRLDLPSLQAKLVQARRGGYCFEHSTWMAAVLEALGYAPQRKLARVTLMGPRATAARTHMFLLVPLDGAQWVVDVGFGALAPQVPLRLQPAGEADAATSHWLKQDGPYWTLCARHRGEVVEAWTALLEDEGPADFEMGNHFVATHPGSPFVNRLMLRALTPEGRVSVMNRDVTEVRGDEVFPRQLASRADLQALLAQHFGIDEPAVAGLRVPSEPQWAGPAA